jgi:pimeloyl-ACP methyl ester carboxylesterase
MTDSSPHSDYITLALPEMEEARIHYLTYGNPTSTPVFCMHGLSCNGYDFDLLARHLAIDYYVIAPDMVGRGRSSHWQDKMAYSNDKQLSLCFALLDALRITQPIHWIGASMGGIMGMMACFLFPARIRSLMLNDVGAVLAKEGLAEIVRSLSVKLPLRDNTRFEAVYRAQNEANFGLQDNRLWQHFFQSRITTDELGNLRLRGDHGVVKPLRALIEATPTIEDISLELLWQHVHCPTLIFRGEHSLLLRQETLEAMASRHDILVETHVIPDVGHMPNLMTKEQITFIHQWLLRQS